MKDYVVRRALNKLRGLLLNTIAAVDHSYPAERTSGSIPEAWRAASEQLAIAERHIQAAVIILERT